MPRLDKPIRQTKAIFVRDRRGGKTYFKREQYNIVVLDWGNGERNSYMEPICGRPLSPSETEELYDEVLYLDAPPFAKSRVGV